MAVYGRRIKGSGATEKTTIAGTEAFPVDGTQYVLISSVEDYVGKRSRVRAATTADITISTALNDTDSLDGVTLATGDMVLVKDQTAPEENGIYVVGVTPARVPQYDAYDDHPGAMIAVQEGTVNADTTWVCTSDAGGTLETTGIVFTALAYSGTYTPTRSAEVNMDSNVTMTAAHWSRVQDEVTVSGRFTADPTAGATASFEITLPIASNIGAAEDASGVAFCGAIAGQGAAIYGVAANDTALIEWVAVDLTSQIWSYIFSYRII
jgi:hypothetical protein